MIDQPVADPWFERQDIGGVGEFADRAIHRYGPSTVPP